MTDLTKVILFQNNDGGLIIVMPADCGFTVEEIARKDVPQGKPFLIVDKSELPQDSTYIDAWTADFSEPDGYGIGADAWFAEQAAKESI